MTLPARAARSDGDGRGAKGVGAVLFVNRSEAGRWLAERLVHLRGRDIVVLGLPRGGVPVAYEIALMLNAPLDVIVVRKLGVPFQPELAMGAIGEDGVLVVNPEVLRYSNVDAVELTAVETAEAAELEWRVARLRRGRPRMPISGRIAVVVDDGIATGSTARAACRVARAHGADRIVLAAPIAPHGTRSAMTDVADEVVCLEFPANPWSIGQWYDDFAQVPESDVLDLLDRAAAQRTISPSSDAAVDVRDRHVARP